MIDILDLCLEKIGALAPEIKINSARLNRDGLVNDVVLVNAADPDGALVFRFPKNEPARQALLYEAHLLELVQGFVNLPAPRLRLLGSAGEECGCYPFLPGEGLHREELLRLEAAGQDRLAAQLAEFLRRLHSIPVELAAQAGIRRADSWRGPQEWFDLYRAAERELFPLLMAHSREWLENHFAPVLAGRLEMAFSPAVIHGDLGPYHILYDRTGPRLAGVIDFGTGGLGDPADDFANIINAFGESFLRRMAKWYPQIAGALERARFRAGVLEVEWLLGGLRTGDPSWFPVHLGRARDVLPFGVGWD